MAPSLLVHTDFDG